MLGVIAVIVEGYPVFAQICRCQGGRWVTAQTAAEMGLIAEGGEGNRCVCRRPAGTGELALRSYFLVGCWMIGNDVEDIDCNESDEESPRHFPDPSVYMMCIDLQMKRFSSCG